MQIETMQVAAHESAHDAHYVEAMYININGSMVCPSHVVRGFINTAIGFHPEWDEMIARHTPCVELTSGAVIHVTDYTENRETAVSALNSFLKSAYAVHKAYWV